MRWATPAFAAVLVALAAPSAAPAADPRGFRGTLTIDYSIDVLDPPRFGGQASGTLSFLGSYNLRGVRRPASDGPSRAYLLEGAGEEFVAAGANVSSTVDGSSARMQLQARADSVVRLVRRPRGERQTSPLVLTLLPRGRFRLALGSLDAEVPGVPLEFTLSGNSREACTVGQGFHGDDYRYERGVFTVVTTSNCPDSDGHPDERAGEPAAQSVWGANVWSSPAQSVQADLCRRRIASRPRASGQQVLDLCGRVRRGGRLRGRATLTSTFATGLCPFLPWGPGGRPNALVDPVETVCGAVANAQPDWKGRLGVDWDLRPLR